MRFIWVDHPSDIGFRAFGKDLAEAFANAGLALFEIMTDTEKVDPLEEILVELEAEDEMSLLYDWIDRLIGLHDSLNMFFSKFEVKIERNSNLKLRAKVWGEKVNFEKHPRKIAVKGMTYHLMEIGKTNDLVYVQAIVDI